MNKNFVLYAVIIFFLLSGYSYTQNFFPLKSNDECQERDYTFYYDSYGISWTEESYPSFNILDSLFYNNKIFYKYKNKYYAFDSLNQKLLIYLNGASYLAVDFNLPINSYQVFYYSGGPRIWKSEGISYENILGSYRLVFTMSADTAYEQGPARYYKSWIIKIVENIGPFFDYSREFQIGMPGEESTLINTKTVIFAKIDTNNINIYNRSVQLSEPVRDRFISEFPYILPLDVTNPITGLISEFYSEFNISRNDSLIFNQTFNIDTSTFLGFINIQPEELLEGDKIQFKCILKDASIFNNVRVTPDSGYYTFYVLPDTANQINDEINKFTHFSLSQNYPNPFNSTTNIQYSLASRQFVTLKIYDVLGNEVAVLINEEKPAGNYEVEFNGSNLSSGISAGGGYASGVYFYQMKAGEFTATKKLILLK